VADVVNDPAQQDMAGQPGQDASRWHNVSADRLRSLVERIERLQEERKALGDDIKDVFQEAKSAGFDAKVLRLLIRLRGMNQADRRSQMELLDLYMHALGME
jgi:uncharacterized protein (UPF0335 family)